MKLNIKNVVIEGGSLKKDMTIIIEKKLAIKNSLQYNI